MNSYERIYNLLTEGDTTGSDPEATGERVGRFMAKTGKGATRSVDITQRIKQRAGNPGYQTYEENQWEWSGDVDSPYLCGNWQPYLPSEAPPKNEF